MDSHAAEEALNRKQLAEQGQQQVVQLMRWGKQLLDTYSLLQPTTDAQQRLQEVQQQYLKAAADVQATLQQCQALQQQEQAAAAAAQQAGVAGQDAAAVADLEAQIAALRQQLEQKNASIKAVIDKLRHLLDAFNMWESHKKHLTQHAVTYAAAGAGSMV